MNRINPCNSNSFLLVYGLGLILFWSCRTLRQESKPQTLTLLVNYPLVIGDSTAVRLVNLKDTIRIFQLNNLVIYRLPESHSIETDEVVPGTETYFAFKKNEKNGYYFKTLNDKAGIKLGVDSILKIRAYFGATIDVNGQLLLVKSQQEVDNGLVEEYANTKIIDENSADSIYLYYSNKSNRIDYTFSRRLDSLKRMKLYKYRILFNERQAVSYKVTVPKREYLFEIRIESNDPPEEIVQFLQRFRKKYGKSL